MVAPLALSPETLANLVSLHDVGDFTSAQAITAPDRLVLWRVTTSRGAFLVRLLAQPTFWDVVHEKDLLLHLANRTEALAGLEIPRMVKNAAGGYFIPVEDRYVSIFAAMEGRELGIFEVTDDTCAQVGAALGRLHLAARDFHGHKRHAARLAAARALWRTIPGDDEKLAELRADLLAEERWLTRHAGRLLPAGIIHGNLSTGATRFKAGSLCGLHRFEDAGRGPLVQDLAAALLAWAFDRDALVPSRCAALLRGYTEVRPLSQVEHAALYAQARLAAAVQTARTIQTHELGGAETGQAYRSYEHPLRRLAALRILGARRFGDLCLSGVAA